MAVHPVAQVVDQLAEYGRLLDGAQEAVGVADVGGCQGIVDAVVGGAVGVGVVVGRLPGQRVVEGRVLGTVEPLVVDVFVECADHPLEAARPGGGEADFLGEAFLLLIVEDRAEGVFGVVEVVAAVDAKVGVLVLLVDVVVPLVGDVPVEERGGRRKLGHTQVASEGQGGLVPVVVTVLVEELDDLEVAEGRVGFPGTPGGTRLGDYPGEHGPTVAGFPERGDTAPGDSVVVEVVLHDIRVVLGVGEIAAEDVVDVAALPRDERGNPEGQAIGHGNVHMSAKVVARFAAPGRVGAGVHLSADTARIGLVGDHAQRPGLGTGSEQRALGPGQCLDAFDVHQPGVHLLGIRGEGLFVEIDRGHAVGAVLGRTGGHAPEHQGIAPGYAVHQGDAGQRVDVLLHVPGAQPFEVVGGERGDALRDILHIGFALGGGDDHLFDGTSGFLFLGLFLGHGGKGGMDRHDRDGQRLESEGGIHRRSDPAVGAGVPWRHRTVPLESTSMAH